MLEIYNTVLYQPLFNLLVWLYNVVPGNDIGLAIIALTILIRIVLFPLYYQSIKSQRALQELQPKVEALKKKYKDEKEKMAQELMVLYKNEKVNPFSSCLPLLVQIPFLIAVYSVFRSGLNSGSLEMLYPFVANPGHIDSISFGFIDLALPSYTLALLAGAAQFVQTKMMLTRKPPLINGKEIEGSQDEKMMSAVNKQMVYFMPFLTVIIGMTLPAGLTLYWFITTALMALQQLWMFNMKKQTPAQPVKNKVVEIPSSDKEVESVKTEEQSEKKETKADDIPNL